MSKTFCPLPWMSLNVRNNGDIRVCCNANSSPNQGLVSKDDGSFYNLGKDNLRDYINADLMKEIRLDMLRGEYHPSCVRCQREDNSGMESRKEWEKTIWQEHIDFEKAKSITSSDGSIDPDTPIKYTDLRFGNLCNLACRMCGPTDSNQWYEDQVAVWNSDSYNDSGMRIKLIPAENDRLKPEIDIYSWYENPEFWNQLEKEIPQLERIYIVGGEPLLIDQHYDFLNKCIDQGRSQNIIVEYNSNLTNIPKRAWDIWKHFKRIQIGASVDGVGKINEYIRYPSKWSQIESNLKKLDTAEGDFKVWIAATIQVYNLLHLPDFMLWKIEQGFKNINSIRWVNTRPVITPHPLHNPDFLNIKIFPKESKEFIKNFFQSVKIEYKDKILSADYPGAELGLEKNPGEFTYRNFCKILDNYTNYMMADDWSHKLDKFWHYTDVLDSRRNQSLKDVSPITYELLKK